jgi:hypothetical protein
LLVALAALFLAPQQASALLEDLVLALAHSLDEVLHLLQIHLRGTATALFPKTIDRLQRLQQYFLTKRHERLER